MGGAEVIEAFDERVRLKPLSDVVADRPATDTHLCGERAIGQCLAGFLANRSENSDGLRISAESSAGVLNVTLDGSWRGLLSKTRLAVVFNAGGQFFTVFSPQERPFDLARDEHDTTPTRVGTNECKDRMALIVAHAREPIQ